MYTYHDNVNINSPILTESIFKQVIPISKNVVMSAYADNENALQALENITGISCEELTKRINENISPYGNVSEVKDKIIKFWNCGTHYFKPNYKYNSNMLRDKNLYIIGEMVSKDQGWVEGAINSVNELTQLMN
jgi:hypothetical protein